MEERDGEGKSGMDRTTGVEFSNFLQVGSGASRTFMRRPSCASSFGI